MNNMFRIFIRVYLVIAVVMLTVLASHSCSDTHQKKAPEFHGVDPQLQKIVDEYLSLSTQNNITFENQVTLGIKTIDIKSAPGAVGVCNYGRKWREIEVDKDFWETATKATKYALLFHELTHCYCGRDHDYGDEKPYKSVDELREENDKGIPHEGGGFYDDNCPTSLMYPMVVDDECMKVHYREYFKEMFKRCEPF